MTGWMLGLAAGLGAAALSRGAARVPVLGWVALTPLAISAIASPPAAAALAGALGLGLACAAAVRDRMLRALAPLAFAGGAAGGALVCGATAWMLARVGPAWAPVVFPALAVLAPLPLRVLGAPRWVSNPLACTQERWLPVVHLARFAGDLSVTAVMALAASAVALALLSLPWPMPTLSVVRAVAGPIAPMAAASEGAAVAAAAGGAVVAAAAICLGALAHRAAARRARGGATLRVAAVVADGPGPARGEALDGLWPVRSADYRDVEATVERYRPHVERAARQGARVVVLPEAAVVVDAASCARWLRAADAWARSLRIAVVAPYFDRDRPRNELAVLDGNGPASIYEKQHPGRGMEPQRVLRTPVAPRVVRAGGAEIALGTAICVDLDYDDLVTSVRTMADVLAAPSNDWFGGFELMHHRTAVWAAVLGGKPLVRAAGHGVSAIYDGAGHVLASASSEHGPVVLIADVRVGARQA
jgi:predicted amidohydrolase